METRSNHFNNLYGVIPTGLFLIPLITGGFTAYLYHRGHSLLTAVLSCLHISTAIRKISGIIFCLIPGIVILIALGVTIGFTLIMTAFALGCAYALPIVFFCHCSAESWQKARSDLPQKAGYH